jgi:hypothetical protein
MSEIMTCKNNIYGALGNIDKKINIWYTYNKFSILPTLFH